MAPAGRGLTGPTRGRWRRLRGDLRKACKLRRSADEDVERRLPVLCAPASFPDTDPDTD